MTNKQKQVCRFKFLQSCLTLEIEIFKYKIEESETGQQLPGIKPRTTASALPLSYDNQETTSPHNPLYVLQDCKHLV